MAKRDDQSGLILLIEDNRGISETVGEFLERRGYSVDYAADGITGLHIAVTNSYDVIEVRNGFIAVINDLHKGRDSGKVWSGLIDASAILLTLVSLTGLLLLFFVYKRRTSGLILATAGTIVCYLIYLRFVP